MKQVLTITSEVKEMIEESDLSFKLFEESMQEYVDMYNHSFSDYEGFRDYVESEGNMVNCYNEETGVRIIVEFSFELDYKHDFVIIDQIELLRD